MKRIGLGIFLLLLCGSLFAGGTADNAASSKTASGNQKIEFTWLHHLEEQGKQDWVNHCVKEYMAQHPDIKINVEMIPNDNFLTMLKTRIASDDAPMIFDLDRVNTLAFVKAGHLADVSDVNGLKKNFNSDILSQGQVNGIQYGVPLDVSGYGVFYNKVLFDKYNLKVPTTADEFRNICDTLQSNGITPLGAPFAESWCLKHFCYAYIYINCVEKNKDWFAQKMSLQSNFSDDEAFKKSIAMMVSYKKYWGKDPFSTSWNDVLSGIAAGKIAMTINGSWTIAGILSLNPDANIRTFAFPVSNDPAQTKMRIEPGNNFCVYNTSNKQVLSAAKDFFSYLCSVESGEYYAKAANGLTGCTVHVDTLPAVEDITGYTGPQVYNMIAISEFNAEYLTAFNDITQKYVMQKTFDMNGYVKELDKSFKAIKQ